jgi:hypothetical protein
MRPSRTKFSKSEPSKCPGIISRKRVKYREVTDLPAELDVGDCGLAIVWITEIVCLNLTALSGLDRVTRKACGSSDE